MAPVGCRERRHVRSTLCRDGASLTSLLHLERFVVRGLIWVVSFSLHSNHQLTAYPVLYPRYIKGPWLPPMALHGRHRGTRLLWCIDHINKTMASNRPAIIPSFLPPDILKYLKGQARFAKSTSVIRPTLFGRLTCCRDVTAITTPLSFPRPAIVQAPLRSFPYPSSTAAASPGFPGPTRPARLLPAGFPPPGLWSEEPS